MKVEIDYTKINNAPCMIAEDEESKFIKGLSQRLQNGSNSCFLVSGYRGSGKTSLICKIREHLKNYKKTIIININLVKYEEIHIVIRKLIRGLFYKFPEKKIFNGFKLIKKNLRDPDKKSNNKFYRYFYLLYLRTFNDVVLSSSYMKNFELNSVSNFTLENFKIIVVWIISLIMALLVKYNIGNIKIFFYVVFIAISLLFLIKLGISFSRNKSEEINVKALFDNDVAEYQLTEVLSGIVERGYKIIFVLDEMDKIEKQNDLEKLITELKPIMLNGLASFLIVSGQKLYYKYLNEETADDSLLSNIFTGLVHVPLKGNDSFKKIFANISTEKDNAGYEIVSLYIDSLILNSNRTMRTFLNLVGKNIQWDDNDQAYLYIDEENEKVYKADSNYLEVIDQIRKDIIIKFGHDDCITDYFTIQLHRWIKIIKQKSAYRFCEEEVFSHEDIDSSLLWIKSDLDFMFAQFLKIMNKKGLLKEFSEGTNKYYINSLDSELEIDNSMKVIKSTERKAINYFSQIEKLLSKIYSECYAEDSTDKDMFAIIEKLVSDKIIEEDFKNKIIDLDGIVSKIEPFEGSSIAPSDINEQLIEIKHELIFYYIYNTIKSKFKKISDGYNKIWENNSNITFTAEEKNEKVLFCYVHLEKIVITNFSLIVDKVSLSLNGYSMAVLLISVQNITAEQIRQIISECNKKKITAILCYYNGRLKTREEIIKYLEQ